MSISISTKYRLTNNQFPSAVIMPTYFNRNTTRRWFKITSNWAHDGGLSCRSGLTQIYKIENSNWQSLFLGLRCVHPYSMVGTGNLVWRHSVSHFSLHYRESFVSMPVEWFKLTSWFDYLPERGKEFPKWESNPASPRLLSNECAVCRAATPLLFIFVS